MENEVKPVYLTVYSAFSATFSVTRFLKESTSMRETKVYRAFLESSPSWYLRSSRTRMRRGGLRIPCGSRGEKQQGKKKDGE